jgi:hypothetical protein
MSGWGNYDAKTVYGTSVNVTNGSTQVVGTGTLFTANLDIGDIIGIHSDLYTKNRVAAIANNTYLTLADPFLGTSNTTLSISFVKLNDQPKYVYQNGGTNGESGFDAMQNTYGVDVTEISTGGANVTAITVGTAGTKYKEVPLVTVSSGTLSANAAISGGAVANVTIATTGGAYATAPTITIGNPYITFNGATGVTAAANTITYTGHLFANGDVTIYNNGGGTTVPGLTTGNTYYIIKTSANAIALASSAVNATNGVQVDITSTGVGAAHTLTLGNSEAATATAVLGVGSSTKSKSAHAGWVKKTTGTGGRSGRIQYETLVAVGSITTDAVDDKTFPDA